MEKLSSIKPSKIYMIGGTAALSDNIKNTLNGITDGDIVRISGDNRYETSAKVCSYFNLDSQNVVMANGENFPDALSGSALAAKLNAPVVLTDGTNIKNQKDYIDSTNYSNVVILGGEGAVSSAVENNFYGTKLNLGESFQGYSNNKANLFIQNTRNGQVIASKALGNYTAGYGEIILADVNGDKIDDIISVTKDEAMKQAKFSESTVEPYIGHGPIFSVCDIEGDGIMVYMK